MSQAAVCVAVRDTLQTLFGLDANSCEVGFDGKPKPMAGKFAISVHPLTWSGISADWDLGEEYQIGVTLSIRLGTVPADRRGIAVWLDQPDGSGLHQRARAAITAIHHSQAVRVAADAAITGGESGKILTPLLLMPGGVQPPKPQSYDWFSAVAPSTQSQTDDAGVSQTIVFGKCQRVQSIPDMD